MPTTQQRELSQAHRRAQVALRASLLREILRIWPLLNLNNISGTWSAFEEAMLSLIRNRGKESQGLAIAYYREIRKAAAVDGRETPRLVDVSPDVIRGGLTVVGAVNAGQQLARGRPVEEIQRATLVNVSGEAVRHSLNFGRVTLLGSLLADKARPRWIRMTGGQPCLWCSAQAAQSHAASERFRAHRHCVCFPVPLY